MAMVCGKCNEGMVMSDFPVVCAGKCGASFHWQCINLPSKQLAKIITDHDNLQFKCNSCLSGKCCDTPNAPVSNVVIGEEEMKKISSVSDSIMDIRNSIAVQIELALKSGMDAIMLNVNGTLKERVDNIETLMTEKMETNCKNFLAAMNEKLSNVTRPAQSEAGQSIGKKRKLNEIDNEKGAKGTDSRDTLTFAEALKKKPEKSNRKARPVIVVKPKEPNQSSEATRDFMKSKLDPKTHRISNFRNGKDGSIIVECATGDNLNDVKKGIESNLGEKYSTVVPAPPVPRLKVLGMSDNLPPDEFIGLLKSQNDDIAIHDVKVVRQYENPRFKYNKYNVVIEVDLNTYKCLMIAKKVNVNWDRCQVVPAVNVLRCFKCGEFGHKSTDCKNPERCSRCSELHKTSECTSTVLKCVNCLKMNKERKMNLDVNHAAFSADCLVYKRLYDQKKSSLRFNK